MSTYSATYNTSTELVSYSYPGERNKKCVMVPHSPELPRFLYIFWPFELYVWLCLLAGIFYIGVLMRFVAEASSTPRNARSFIRNLPHALSISLYTNNMGLNIKQAPLMVLFFYALLYLYGFIISAYHMPHLTSVCTKPLFKKLLNTVEDILETRLKIIIKNTSLRELQHSNHTKWPILAPKMLNVTGKHYQELLESFDNQYAYVVALDQWHYLNRQQRYLSKPIFHLSRVCFSSALRSLPVQFNWSHIDELNIYLLRVQESGFWQHWIEMAFIDAVSTGDARILLDTHPVRALTFEFFIIAWCVIAIGAVISFAVMIIERFFWLQQIRKGKQQKMKLKILKSRKINKKSFKNILTFKHKNKNTKK